MDPLPWAKPTRQRGIALQPGCPSASTAELDCGSRSPHPRPASPHFSRMDPLPWLGKALSLAITADHDVRDCIRGSRGAGPTPSSTNPSPSVPTLTDFAIDMTDESASELPTMTFHHPARRRHPVYTTLASTESTGRATSRRPSANNPVPSAASDSQHGRQLSPQPFHANERPSRPLRFQWHDFTSSSSLVGSTAPTPSRRRADAADRPRTPTQPATPFAPRQPRNTLPNDDLP
jgi:hypothetical protein